MSLFDQPPAQFPLRVACDTQPIHYTIRSDTSDAIAVILLGIVWAVVGTVVLYFVVGPFFADLMGDPVAAMMTWGLIIAFLIAWWRYVQPVVTQHFRTVDVSIVEHLVTIRLKTPFREQQWSDPLTHYEGVAQLNLGHHDIGPTKTYLSSVVLKHPDPDKSVPLVIDEMTQVGEKTVQHYAHELGLQALAGMGDETGAQAYPAGTIVENRGRGRLLSGLFWLFVLTFAVASYATVSTVLRGDEHPTILLLLPFLALLLFALHIFGTRYVTQMRAWQGDFYIRTSAVQLQDYRFVSDQFTHARRFEGKSEGQHTPGIWLWVSGKRLPFLIDLQSEFVDEDAIFSLVQERNTDT